MNEEAMEEDWIQNNKKATKSTWDFDKEKLKDVNEFLTNEQNQVLDMLLNFVNSEREYFMLEGYAGTGKTTVVSKFVGLLPEKCKIVMTAPTNKAVKVLADNKEVSGIEYGTIHKLLNLTLQMRYPDKKKGENFEPHMILVPKRYGENTVNEYNLIILDEASMLDDDLFLMLHDIKDKDVKVIFMGDPAQIPPVNQADSIPLKTHTREEYDIQHAVLKTIMRQADGSAIKIIGQAIRDNRFTEQNPIRERVNGKDVFFYNSHNHSGEYGFQSFTLNFLKLFSSEEFKESSDHCKVIAWTNKVVDNTNDAVRKFIFRGQILRSIMLGEKLIADKPIFEDGTIIFNTSDEFEVVEVNEKTVSYKIPKWIVELKNTGRQQSMKFDTDVEHEETGGKYSYQFEVFRCKVASYDSVSKTITYKYIDVLTEYGSRSFNWARINLKKIAVKSRDNRAWKEYYKLDEMFARVKYNYAITAHKAQGSTYKNVFIIEDDIDQNKKLLERNRIKYTACTRPSKTLHILSKRNTSFAIEPQLEAFKREDM
jgi:ATP-dependent exoDNAse (exonuclease V) alpha subunit